MINRKYSEIKSLKIAGTKFDRRTKLTSKDKQDIIELFKHKDEMGFTYKDIADAYGISVRHLCRCRSAQSYKEYLDRQKQDSKKYLEKNEVKCSNSIDYKCALLDIIDKYKLKSLS